jgi:hypothetical protein
LQLEHVAAPVEVGATQKLPASVHTCLGGSPDSLRALVPLLLSRIRAYPVLSVVKNSVIRGLEFFAGEDMGLSGNLDIGPENA